jgi:hypothetical protein
VTSPSTSACIISPTSAVAQPGSQVWDCI